MGSFRIRTALAAAAVAMDEQKRDADGKFGSGGGSSAPGMGGRGRLFHSGEVGSTPGVGEHRNGPKELTSKGSTKFKEGTKVTFKTPSGKTRTGTVHGPAASEGKVLIKTGGHSYHSIHESAVAQDSEAPNPTTLQGEAGRMARQQARDCMTGRFRQ